MTDILVKQIQDYVCQCYGQGWRIGLEQHGTVIVITDVPEYVDGIPNEHDRGTVKTMARIAAEGFYRGYLAASK